MPRSLLFLWVLTLAVAGTARAEVAATSATGFRLQNTATIDAPPADVYAALGRIGAWWDDAHTYSGKAANMTLELKPGGCFCEALAGGGVKHGEVVSAMPSQVLRLSAALGPLQAEGVSAALTFTLGPDEKGGTLVVQSYNVGGARPEMIAAAPVIDDVIGGQLRRLKRYLETGRPN